jgi:hypothetical protein
VGKGKKSILNRALYNKKKYPYNGSINSKVTLLSIFSLTQKAIGTYS